MLGVRRRRAEWLPRPLGEVGAAGGRAHSEATTQMTWPFETGSPGRNAQLGDHAVSVGDDLVLHLHRLDDADELAGRDRVAFRDRDREHRSLHRARHRPGRTGREARAARSVPARQLGPRRLATVQSDLVQAAVDLHRDDLFACCTRRSSVRERGYLRLLMRQPLADLLRSLRKLLRLDDVTATAALHEAGRVEERSMERRRECSAPGS